MASERQISVGGVLIGGGAPVAVQTMTKTETADLQATLEQIRCVADAGADLVRVAVPRDQDVEALRTIVRDSPIPVIADIHFNYTLALKALDAGADCVRLNPGNIGGPDKVALVAKRANELGTPLRIGVNSGSLPAHLRELEFENPVEALVTAAVQFDMDSVVAEVERRLAQYDDPIEVSVLGCAVNGIGEARHADFGITGAKDMGMIYSRGEPLKKVPTERLVDELFAEIDRYYAAGKRVLRDETAAAEAREWLAENEDATAMTPERLAALEAEAADGEAAGNGAARLDEELSP